MNIYSALVHYKCGSAFSHMCLLSSHTNMYKDVPEPKVKLFPEKLIDFLLNNLGIP